MSYEYRGAVASKARRSQRLLSMAAFASMVTTNGRSRLHLLDPAAVRLDGIGVALPDGKS